MTRTNSSSENSEVFLLNLIGVFGFGLNSVICKPGLPAGQIRLVQVRCAEAPPRLSEHIKVVAALAFARTWQLTLRD